MFVSLQARREKHIVYKKIMLTLLYHDVDSVRKTPSHNIYNILIHFSYEKEII